MEMLGFTPEEIVAILKIPAAVLKLGNLTFIPTNNIDGTEGCNISNIYGKENVYVWVSLSSGIIIFITQLLVDTDN